jgi:hypothetical protein
MSAADPVELVLSRLQNVKKNGTGTSGACPVPNCTYRVSIGRSDDGRALVSCVGGHRADDVVAALGLKLSDLFVPNGREKEGGAAISPRSTPQHPNASGLTLAGYAEAKRLDSERLRAVGLTDCHYLGLPAVRMAYFDTTGNEITARFRVRLDKGENDDRFRWKRGSKAVTYGQNRLAAARERGYITLVEGESDCHTLWQYNEPALGISGAGCWNDDRDAPLLDGIETIYVVREPDAGGDVLMRRMATSVLRDRVRVVSLGDCKDPSALHLADPASFPARWQAAKETAVPLADIMAGEEMAASEAAWATCQMLAHAPDLLDRAAETVAVLGVAGEMATVKIVFLAGVSRLLQRPVNLALKGPSSAGKSFIVQQTLRLFPDEAYYALTAMSERALAYSDEPLRHRILVIYEAAGLSGDMASYFVRSLLSEGRIDYETVEKTRDGLRARRISREGPTGLIVTTTAASLHPENETRLLSILVSDSPEQTAAVLLTIANGHSAPPDLAPWHALQRWLAGGPCDVLIPFADVLARLIPPKAVRLRRDFGTVVTLVKAYALLHRASRDLDSDGRIVATIADYAAVRELVEPLVASGVEATVPLTMRETISTVAALVQGEEAGATVSNQRIATALRLDKSSTSTRVKAAIQRGYLVNHEDRRGRPAKIALGDRMPEDTPILPTPDQVLECWGADAGVIPPPALQPSREVPGPDPQNDDTRRQDPLFDLPSGRPDRYTW